MKDADLTHEQNHPLYSIDRDLVDRLLAQQIPGDKDLIDLARLLLRYDQFPGAFDLKEDLLKTMKAWGYSRETLNARTRQIWVKGYRPGSGVDEKLGSSFDTSDEEKK